MTLKRTTIVMLATSEKAPIADNHGQLVLANGSKDKLFDTSKYFEGDRNLKPQHLYFLSENEIKEGDWCIKLSVNKVFQCKEVAFLNSKWLNDKKEVTDVKKIIATTDSSLRLESEEIIAVSAGFKQSIPVWDILPQPSQSFLEVYIREYNKGNILKEVMVEYEDNLWIQDYAQTPTSPLPPMVNLGGKLKVNPKDNTITIKRMKDSWSREEVHNLMMQSWIYGEANKGAHYTVREKWIEQNM